MSPNNYNVYNYPYQQSSSQQHSEYQVVASTNSGSQPNPSYQHAPAMTTSPATDYTSYPTNNYNGNSSTYNVGQGNSWTASNYGSNLEATSRAAEVLHNMSNNTYIPNMAESLRQPSFTATNATSSSTRYSTNATQAQHVQPSQQTPATHPAYGTLQARPRNVNTNPSTVPATSHGLSSPPMAVSYASQRAQTMNNQEQHSSSPPHNSYINRTTSLVNTTKNTAITTTNQYDDYSCKLGPMLDTPHSTESAVIAAPYNYAETQVAAPLEQTKSATNVSEQYNQSAITVDPMAVYDPWPEYQRKQEALRVQKAVENAACAEKEPKIIKTVSEEKSENKESARQPPLSQSSLTSKKGPEQQPPVSNADSPNSSATTQQFSEDNTGTLEAEIRAMMAKMREINGKDPALLARIWEEERRAKVPKSPVAQTKLVPQPAVTQAVQASGSHTANQMKPPLPEEPSYTTAGKVSQSSVTQPLASKPQPQSVASTSGRPSGNTIWPSEKKSQLANAAATYLNAQNPSKLLNAEQVLSMLDSNPSYIELCEQLEGKGLRLDRATFAKTLLTTVSDMNSASRPYTPKAPPNRAVVQKVQAPPIIPAKVVALPGPPRPPPNGTLIQKVQAPPRIPAKVVAIPGPPRPPPNGTVMQGIQAPPAIPAKVVATAVTPRPPPNDTAVQAAHGLPVIPAKMVVTPGAPSPQYPSAQSTLGSRPFSDRPDKTASASHSLVQGMKTIPVKAGLKPPVNKEEAARKRTFGDLMDLTLLDEEDDSGPLPKKQNANSMYSYQPLGPIHDRMDTNERMSQTHNFPVPERVPQVAPASTPLPQYAPSTVRYANLVQPIDRRKALRRNTYNIKTIARDVLLACGRHPDERQLNGHLDILRVSLPQITSDADLSTVRWDMIDPGEPPRGYFKYGIQGADAEDADDESTNDENGSARPHMVGQAIGGEGMIDPRVQVLPQATNPFKVKRRGRPPRHSYPLGFTAAETPHRVSSSPNPQSMSASAPHPTAGSVGYRAFRVAVEYGPDGKPLPKKKGRPVGWRKAIHGSSPSQARPAANDHTEPAVHRFKPSQPSSLRNVRTEKQPIVVNSRSPSVPNKMPSYQSFKCKWKNCKAELHNFDTLKKHVQKIHRKETPRGTIECLWGECGREITNVNQVTNMMIERHAPFTFIEESRWREHLDSKHFNPILWELGDGPASGLSDAQDSEAYLSDAQGRRVTPRIMTDMARQANTASASGNPSPAPRGRGRPPKASPANDVQKYLVSQKKRLGGPGMDRGGATLVTDKRRRGFSDNDETEEEFVDAES